MAISPDGKYILSVVDDKGQQSLWLRNVPTNSNTQVMPPEAVQYLGVRFSPDGNYLYFVRGEPGQALKFLYRAPVLGGTPQKLVTDVDTNVTFSPDGRSLAYCVMNNPGARQVPAGDVFAGNRRGENAGRRQHESKHCTVPAWSPDGKTHRLRDRQPGDAPSADLMAVNAVTGKQDLIFEVQRRSLVEPRVAARWQRLAGALYRQRKQFHSPADSEDFPSRPYLRAVTHDINDYSDLSISADGHMLAAVLNQGHFDLFVSPASIWAAAQVSNSLPGRAWATTLPGRRTAK